MVGKVLKFGDKACEVLDQETVLKSALKRPGWCYCDWV